MIRNQDLDRRAWLAASFKGSAAIAATVWAGLDLPAIAAPLKKEVLAATPERVEGARITLASLSYVRELAFTQMGATKLLTDTSDFKEDKKAVLDRLSLALDTLQMARKRMPFAPTGMFNDKNDTALENVRSKLTKVRDGVESGAEGANFDALAHVLCDVYFDLTWVEKQTGRLQSKNDVAIEVPRIGAEATSEHHATLAAIGYLMETARQLRGDSRILARSKDFTKAQQELVNSFSSLVAIARIAEARVPSLPANLLDRDQSALVTAYGRTIVGLRTDVQNGTAETSYEPVVQALDELWEKLRWIEGKFSLLTPKK